MAGYIHPCLVNDTNTGPFSPEERALYNTQQQQQQQQQQQKQQQRSNMQPLHHNNGYNGYGHIEKGTERNMQADEQQYNHTNDSRYMVPIQKPNGGHVEADDNASHLSFLYDKAQGGEYGTGHPQQISRPIPQAPAAVGIEYPGFGNRANPAPSTISGMESCRSPQGGTGNIPTLQGVNGNIPTLPGTDCRTDRHSSGSGSDSGNSHMTNNRTNAEEGGTNSCLANARALRSLRNRTPSPSRWINDKTPSGGEYGTTYSKVPNQSQNDRIESCRSPQGGNGNIPTVLGTDCRKDRHSSGSGSDSGNSHMTNDRTNAEEGGTNNWLANARALRSLRNRTPSPSRWINDKTPSGGEYATTYSKVPNQSQNDTSNQPPLPPMSTHPLVITSNQDIQQNSAQNVPGIHHLGNSHQMDNLRGSPSSTVSEPSAFLAPGGGSQGDYRSRQGSASSGSSEAAQGSLRGLRLRDRSPSPDILKQRTVDELSEKLSQAQLSRQIHRQVNNPGQGQCAMEQPQGQQLNQSGPVVNRSASRENLADPTLYKTSPSTQGQQIQNLGQCQGQSMPRQVSQVCSGDSKESMRNYETWKAAVNQRKMSLPGYVDSARMQRFQRQVPPTELPRAPRPCAKSQLDATSIRQQLREGDEPVVEDYEQESIRYKGKMNPSKIFRELQTVTNSNESEIIHQHLQAKPPARRRVRREEGAGYPDANADDIVDISYVGGKIPSRTFRQLQEAMGQDDYSIWDSSPYDRAPSQPARHVKVIHLRRHSVDNIL